MNRSDHSFVADFFTAENVASEVMAIIFFGITPDFLELPRCDEGGC